MASDTSYDYWQKDAIATLARSQNLTVTSTAKNPVHGPSRGDYLKAVQKADRCWKGDKKFRSLDLPPELRNAVYYELLGPRTVGYQVLASNLEGVL